MATEDEMVGWHHQLNGQESEQIVGDSEGQGSLVCCGPQAEFILPLGSLSFALQAKLIIMDNLLKVS